MKQIITIFLSLFFGAVLTIDAQTKYVGGDISVLQSYEDNNVAYYDMNGTKIDDVLQYMKGNDVGWNAQRVRLFVNPTRKAPDGSTDAQVCQDLDYVKRLAKRIKEEGFALMLDFHYSDTWADPANQWTPAEWLSLSDEELATKVYEYTKECLQELVAVGATPDFIQPGNEISYGMLWGAYGTKANRCYTSNDANWDRFRTLLGQAILACREVCPQAKIIIHTERAGNWSTTRGIYERLASVDYDIIGLSYYPFWHNSLSVLASTLNQLASYFPDKRVQIVETDYYYQWQPNDVSYDFSSIWSISPEGQKAFTQDLITELKKHANVDGLFWWFPEENGNGPNSKVLTNWVNRGLWDDNTHRALPALYVLKDFLDEQTGIHEATIGNTSISDGIFTIDGKQVSKGQMTTGLYIVNGKKTMLR